jgi:transcriptional regulator of acetoin/glycerol metabolism
MRRKCPDAEASHLVLVAERTRLEGGGACHSLANIDRVTVGRGSSRSAKRFGEGGVRVLAITIPDPRMSSVHATINRVGTNWVLTDCESTNGSQLRRSLVSQAKLADGDLIELAGTFFRFRAALKTPVAAPADVDSADLRGLARAFGTLLPWLGRDLDDLSRVARSEVSVLLQGESGTGKEVLARAMHAESGRQGPFVAINCGAIPAGLVESTLFGHKKGAFSGATNDEAGVVRAAHGGTLLLDEIGDLPAPSQAALLRVLQEREVLPVGATRPVRVDVRVLAATHRPLSSLAASGAFRVDLFARIAAFTFELPPLRSRIDDMGQLLSAILQDSSTHSAGHVEFSANAMHALLTHAWANNVRELAQCISVNRALATGNRFEEIRLRGATATPEQPAGDADLLSPENEALRAQVVQKLIEHRGNITHVAVAMGKARSQVQRWVRRFKLETRAFRQ